MTGTTKDLINYRIERAKETLEDAKLLTEKAAVEFYHLHPGNALCIFLQILIAFTVFRDTGGTGARFLLS